MSLAMDRLCHNKNRETNVYIFRKSDISYIPTYVVLLSKRNGFFFKLVMWLYEWVISQMMLAVYQGHLIVEFSRRTVGHL